MERKAVRLWSLTSIRRVTVSKTRRAYTLVECSSLRPELVHLLF